MARATKNSISGGLLGSEPLAHRHRRPDKAKPLRLPLRIYPVYSNLSAAFAHAGKMDEAKAALAEARRLNPAITIKWMKEHTPNPDRVRRRPQGGAAGGMSEARKLAAILVADVVDYSRLAGADEDRTLVRLRGLRSDVIDPTIAAHHGRVGA